MSQATTVCDSWEIEVIRLTKEVSEQSTRIAGRNTRIPSYCSSVHLPSSRMECGPALNARKSWFQPLWSAERNPWEHILLLYRTRDRLLMKVLPKRKEAEKIGIWALAASGKIQFLESLCPQRTDNKISSSSIDQRMVSRNWFGIWYGRTGPFKVHMRQRGNENFETRESKIVNRIMKIGCPAEVKRMINYLAETQWKTNVQCLRANKLCFTFFFTLSIRLKGTRSDALDLDLYGDILKMLNLAGRKTWPALGHDLDAHVLENVYERQVKKWPLMKHAMTLYQQNIAGKGDERLPMITDCD